MKIELWLADGSHYGQTGRLDFADRALNPQTGTLTLRASFPNPDGLLRPGMTGRVHAVYDTIEQAVVIPQKAVSEMLGKSLGWVVGADGTAAQRLVKTGDRLGDQWLILEGLKAGETIVVEGVQKVRPDMPVKAVPIGPAPAAAPSAARP